MAKRRSSGSTAIVRAVQTRPVAPVIRIQAPRSIAAPKKKTHHRRRSASAMGSGKTLIGTAVGGAVLGFIEKQFPTLPTVPLLGRAGTIAVAAHFLSKQGGQTSGILRDVALAGAAIAGYQLGKEGKVSGDDDVSGDIAQQVRGIASQV
jgi:hypothetical protein